MRKTHLISFHYPEWTACNDKIGSNWRDDRLALNLIDFRNLCKEDQTKCCKLCVRKAEKMAGKITGGEK